RRANSAPALSASAPVSRPADSRERLFALPEFLVTRRANSALALSASAPVPRPADSRERLFALPEHPHYP
ncbi:hypothetical protein, partial [Pseudomonas aeruginosa]|uniref:hypothetical protein n=1 Tax=Pseudomonas aeruginosa TaxID=287 RepID=UPI0023424145